MHTSRLTFSALLITLALSTSGCIIHVGGHNNDSDKSSVFGGFDISKNSQIGDISSVNGGIVLQDGVTAEDVSTVNGSIEIGKNVKLIEASTVNGDIEAKNNLKVENYLGTINGSITLQNGSQVGSHLSNVNGEIVLTGTTIGGDIETINGDITLSHNSIIEGDILFDSNNDSGWWGKHDGNNSHTPTLTIDASSTVKGKIVLERKVVLEIANSELLEKIERHYKTEQ